jgi:uncharacterized protein YcnI
LLTAAGVATLVLAPAASAHITASPSEIPAGFTYTQFSVPHGCDGSSTVKVSIRIPEGIAEVKPEVAPGWDISTKTGALAAPVSVFGEEESEGVTEVSWSGGPLPDSELQRFGLSFFASEDLAGQTVYWPIVQQCEEGTTRWIEIPVQGEEEPPEPAPGISFLASAEEGGGGEAAEETDTGGAESSGGGDVEATAGTSDDDGSGRADAALVVGGLGLAAGLAALGVALFRKPKGTN